MVIQSVKIVMLKKDNMVGWCLTVKQVSYQKLILVICHWTTFWLLQFLCLIQCLNNSDLFEYSDHHPHCRRHHHLLNVCMCMSVFLPRLGRLFRSRLRLLSNTSCTLRLWQLHLQKFVRLTFLRLQLVKMFLKCQVSQSSLLQSFS